MADESKFLQESAFPVKDNIVTPEAKQKKEEYRQRLAHKLKDPEFRKIEGFPLGTDEAILALSDPPYYTACPNPFLPEILDEWQEERRQTRKELDLLDDENVAEGFSVYHREPFAADVSEGKNDPIYNAHSYHTKVPHKAIMRYILHYTDPGDIVFDGFCGTGMTGVAAQLCGDKKVVESLGYRVDKKGIVFEGEKAISRLGARKAALNDLSPAATFIAYNYNTPVNVRAFERETKQILDEVEKECGWMYDTWHPNVEDFNKVKGKINYTVWSDVFRCPNCSNEMIFWNVAVNAEEGKINENWVCKGCGSHLAKSPLKNSGILRAERIIDTLYDRSLGQTIRQARQVPVLIYYSVGKKRFIKRLDSEDLKIIQKIEESEIPYPFPLDRMPVGGESRRNDEIGLTHVHHYYTQRNLRALATIQEKARLMSNSKYRLRLLIILQSISSTLVSKLARFNMGNRGNGPVSGTLYVASLTAEANTLNAFNGKFSDFLFDQKSMSVVGSLVQSSSSSRILSIDKKIDYLFVDPPFGSNLMYSELNFLWEAWLKLITNNESEAIINKEQKKGITIYQEIMENCFLEFNRILKPGRWMTVEFHNSQNSVWNSIQEALMRAGFVIADVRTLDKQQATFKQVSTSAAVKQDLVISTYKPTAEFVKKFDLEGGSVIGAWEFIRQHLENLPTPNLTNGNIEIQGERMPYLLYDRMVAFHLVRGLTVPLASSEFYQGLTQRWLMRDGMVFTATQATTYDQLRLNADRVQQLALFVTDEASAIQWLMGELNSETGTGPLTYSQIQPKFLKQWHPEKYEKLPELQVILEQNFLHDEKEYWYVPDPENTIHLEALRERDLLHEFSQYLAGTGKIKVFRAEAVKAGFSKAWADHEYNTIIKVAERLPEQALQEDSKLKLYYDNALNRAPKEIKQERLI